MNFNLVWSSVDLFRFAMSLIYRIWVLKFSIVKIMHAMRLVQRAQTETKISEPWYLWARRINKANLAATVWFLILRKALHPFLCYLLEEPVWKSYEWRTRIYLGLDDCILGEDSRIRIIILRPINNLIILCISKANQLGESSAPSRIRAVLLPLVGIQIKIAAAILYAIEI